MKRILLVSPSASALVQFRLAFIRALKAAGHDVHVVMPDESEATDRAIREIGVTIHAFSSTRTGTDPLTEWRSIRSLRRVIGSCEPDVVLGYAHKGVLYSGIALRGMHGIAHYGLLSGLGIVFTGKHWKRRAARCLFRLAYRCATVRTTGLFFLNPDDRREMAEGGFFSGKVPLHVISGEGVDLCAYPAVAVPDGPVSFLMIARLLRDKGVYEYLEAAKKVRATHPGTGFHLLGAMDSNPSSLSAEELERFVKDGHVTYHGQCADVTRFLAACSVYVLPSYREGLPRSTMEALATGRAVITTDVPGCRETVAEGVNGFLVPAADSDALAGAMRRFLNDPRLRADMGEASRHLAETRFEVGRVNRTLLEIMALS